MKKIVVMMTIFICIVSNEMLVASQTINEADTDLCDTLKYALINRLREPIDKAIGHIYQDDDEAPEGLTWASYDTEILKIKQLYGVGGTYEITLEVNHITALTFIMVKILLLSIQTVSSFVMNI